jgi:hypothetical protein
MTLGYLLLSLLAGAGFYLACAHQRLWPPARPRARALRAAAWLAALFAAAAAIAAMGAWAGVFAALTALMLVLVALPCVDAWRQLRRRTAPGDPRHVG